MNVFAECFSIIILLAVYFVSFIFLLRSNFTKKHYSRIARERFLYCFFAGSIFFCLQHAYMSMQLHGIKAEFIQAAQSEYRTTNMQIDGGDVYYTVDYGGMIDKILKKRNAFLKKNRYHILGSWYITTHPGNETDTSVSAIYIWIPFI
jgi:hypothetical protein